MIIQAALIPLEGQGMTLDSPSIERFEPEVQNAALAKWNIVIELENNNMQEEFRAVFIDRHAPSEWARLFLWKN